jgi:hypothetical protein
MNTTPFIYGNTVSNKAFTDREADSTKLYSNLMGGINTMLISPRRWGKSSLVEKVIADINQNSKQHKTIIIDLFSVSDESEFLEKFAQEVIKASSSKFEEWIKNSKIFFKNLTPKISLGLDPFSDFSISFDLNDLQKHKDEILNLPETIANKKEIKFIIALDEFQNLANFREFESLERKMRANWQRQKNVTYCLFGSKRHMMLDIFNNASKPFYRFGDIILLQKIDKAHWIKFIVDNFSNTNKLIAEEDAAYIADLMQNHSWYVQQLSHYIWNKTTKWVNKEIIDLGLNELLNANTPLFQKEIETISTTQLNLLKAVLNNETQLTSASVMQKYKLGTPRNVSKNIKILQKKDIIENYNNSFIFLDPVFKIWFKQTFLNR